MIWIWLNSISVFLYGMILTFSFLRIKYSKKNTAITAVFFMCCQLVSYIIATLWGFDVVDKTYPLLVHLPLFLLCVFCFKNSPSSSLTALLISFLLTIPRNYLGLIAMEIFPNFPYILDIAKFAVTLPLLILLLRFFSPFIQKFLRQCSQILYIMVIPFALYYVIIYVTTIYTNLLWQSSIIIYSLVGMLFALILFILSSVVARQSEQFMSLKQQQEMLILQSEENKKRLDEIRNSQLMTRTMRHDMKHYMQIIDDYASKNDTSAIRDYVRQVQSNIEKTVFTPYCLNEQVNLVLSSYIGKATRQGIKSTINVNVPEQLDESLNLDLCILLANALENATSAAAVAPIPWLELTCRMIDKKIVIQLSNACLTMPIFKNGIPKSNRNGHGFGSYSITILAEKHGGTADFSCHDGIFTMRAVM